MIARRGYTLVEMMVVVVLLGVAGSLTIQVMVTMFRADAHQQEEFATDYALGQLERSLWDDVHAAQQAEIEGNRLLLTVPGKEQVAYVANAQAVSRERLRSADGGEQVIGRDRFALPRGLAITWRKETLNDIAWLLIEFHPHDAESPEGRKKPRVHRDVHFQIRIGRGQSAPEETP